MSQAAIKLKPCPFCGSNGLSYSDRDIDGWVSNVKCDDCDDVTGPMSEYKYDDLDEAKEDAARKWNTRALYKTMTEEHGYVDAFYKIAELMGINASSRTPKDVFENDMLPRLSAALTLTGTVGVKVLTWEPYPNPRFASDDVAIAIITGFGVHKYQVQCDPDGAGYIAFLAPDFGTMFWVAKGFPTLAAAKAAAQADYETRIRSALTASQPSVGERTEKPVAWRWRSAFCGETIAPDQAWLVSTVKVDRSGAATDFEIEPLYPAPPSPKPSISGEKLT